MEAVGRSLRPPSPSSPASLHVPRITTLSSSPASTLHDQDYRLVISTLTSTTARHFPASVLLQEQRDDLRSYPKDVKRTQVMLDRRNAFDFGPLCEEKQHELTEYVNYFEGQLLRQPAFGNLLPSSMIREQLSSIFSKCLVTEADAIAKLIPRPEIDKKFSIVRPLDALALAKKAMLASQEAVAIAENIHLPGANLGEYSFSRLDPENSMKLERPTIRSGRLLQRHLKKRKTLNEQASACQEYSNSIPAEINRKISKGLGSNDPFRLFLGSPETRQLLTVSEERELFVKIQELMRVEEVKSRLHMQFLREPTFIEWAEAAGMSSRELQLHLTSGNRSREKMIYANFRLVIHVAKQYHGQGLCIEDLLQVGSVGLMKSLEKFKPKAGCRFPTYAYWWIRQSIKKAIFQNSRTIRLPENVFALLKKIKNARRLFIQEGHKPTDEDLAKRVGITVQKLGQLLISSRSPVSIQESVWTNQDATYQEITADPEIETPEACVSKQMMRQHVRNFLGVLSPRERHIIKLRYGIHDGKPKTLSQIGDAYGVSKERIRQLESRAMDKLKESLSSHGLEGYVCLLT